MSKDLGTVNPGKTIYIEFDSFGADGQSLTLSGLAVTDVEVYKDGSVTQRSSDAGYTLLDTDGIDFDATTGIHGLSINLADNTDAGFWSAGSHYRVVIASVTINTQTVSFTAATFRIGYTGAILDTTIATLASQTSFTLTSGPAEDDALNGCIVLIHDVASAVQKGFAVVSDYTGATKTVTLAAGTTFTAAATDNISLFPPANVTALGGDPQSLTDLKDFADAGYDPATNKVQGVVLVDTTTAVTNQLTAAQIATGVWQDTTAGDFTVASSIGKTLYIANVAPGGSGGLLISGSNAGTTTFGALTVTGALTAGSNALPWNAAYDAEVQSEVEDAIVVHRLDELLNADSDIDGLAPPTVGSVFHELMSKTAGSFTFDQTTDSLEAVRDNVGTAGAGLTAIDLPDQTFNLTGNITGNLSGSVGSVTAAITLPTIPVDWITSSGLAASAVTEIQAGLSTLDAAGVRTAVGLASANLDTQLAALPTAAENATELFDQANGIETGYTLRQTMRAIAAKAAGLISGAGTGTEVIKAMGASAAGTTRLTATVDASGNISAWTPNL